MTFVQGSIFASRLNKTNVAISVIVPIYNVERYLPQCLDSLLQQTQGNIEIILVDDGSSDSCGTICDEYATKDSRIQAIHKKNEGVSAARNDGMKVANGEYIIFADSDDTLPEDALASLFDTAKQTGADITIGDVNQIFARKDKRTHFYADAFVISEKEQIQELIKADFYNRYCPWPYEGRPAFGYGGPWNKLVRRRLLVDNGINFDVRTKGIFDDIIYTANILAVAKKVAYVPYNVYNYRMLDVSITKTYKENMLEINQGIFKAWEDFLDKYNQNGVYTAAYYASVLRRFDESLEKYFFSSKNPKSEVEWRKELRKIMHSAPYMDIPKFVEPKKLSKKHFIEYKLLKTGSVNAMCAFYSALGIYRAIKAKDMTSQLKA